jgi:protein TonB
MIGPAFLLMFVVPPGVAVTNTTGYAAPVAVSNDPQPPVVRAVPPGESMSPFSVIAVPAPTPRVLVPTAAPPRHEPPRPMLLHGPEPRRPAQDYLTVEDYPRSALAMNAQGRVRFTLDVGVDGRVASCLIVESSGQPSLDSATCRLMRSRARFTPAIDTNGNPAQAYFDDSVEWTLPEVR